MATPNKSIRRTILHIISEGGSPHVGTAFSMVEILNAVFKTMDLAKIKKRNHARDRFVLSKGHGASALYAVMHEYGLLSKKELLTYHKNGSLLAGHASHFVRFVEHSTGALGHGLAVGVGMAIGLKSLRSGARVFVVVGDGELNEGSNWEALMLAGHLRLRNLCVLIDNNGMDQMGKLEQCCNIEPLKQKFESFNFSVSDVDGHNEEKIVRALDGRREEKPQAIICHTVKGKGVSFMEGNTVWHYRTPQGTDYEKALKELEGE